ncbi:hypothetical protein CWI36_0983p0020 [Hamiltosporidium magnivora]|uniref:Uncharacterized protein n=1 Tax=Hamiltosporidium magnivora TaxID=148818 RepID=A0A4Q9L6H5_9MICR|nr:hypothetical protein CWI36_0983p0020 [Hamiltosporidium magnivora]
MGVIMRAEMHEEPTPSLKEAKRDEDGFKIFLKNTPLISERGTILEEPTININEESDLEEETGVVKEIVKLRFMNQEVYTLNSEDTFENTLRKIFNEPVESYLTHDPTLFKDVEFNYDTTNGYKSEKIKKYLKSIDWKKETILLPYCFNIEYFKLFESLVNFRIILENFNVVFNDLSLYFKDSVEPDLNFYTSILECFPSMFINNERFLFFILENLVSVDNNLKNCLIFVKKNKQVEFCIKFYRDCHHNLQCKTYLKTMIFYLKYLNIKCLNFNPFLSPEKEYMGKSISDCNLRKYNHNFIFKDADFLMFQFQKINDLKIFKCDIGTVTSLLNHFKILRSLYIQNDIKESLDEEITFDFSILEKFKDTLKIIEIRYYHCFTNKDDINFSQLTMIRIHSKYRPNFEQNHINFLNKMLIETLYDLNHLTSLTLLKLDLNESWGLYCLKNLENLELDISTLNYLKKFKNKEANKLKSLKIYFDQYLFADKISLFTKFLWEYNLPNNIVLTTSDTKNNFIDISSYEFHSLLKEVEFCKFIGFNIICRDVDLFKIKLEKIQNPKTLIFEECIIDLSSIYFFYLKKNDSLKILSYM